MRPSARASVRLVALVLLVLATSPAALGQTIPPAPTSWVTDSAGLLSPRTASDLNDRLRSFERRTGHQILVYIAPTTGGVPIEDWALRAFARWKVGRKNLDDGLVLFIFPRDRTLRIEVGYGLEPAVPDALAARILRTTIEPGLRTGQADRAVSAGIDRILALAGGDSARAGSSDDDGSATVAPSPLDLVAIGLVLFVMLALAFHSPWRALAFLVNVFGGRGGRGGRSSGGGFLGGGGRSGGGGASGRW